MKKKIKADPIYTKIKYGMETYNEIFLDVEELFLQNESWKHDVENSFLNIF